jgi:hypothetical protein
MRCERSNPAERHAAAGRVAVLRRVVVVPQGLAALVVGLLTVPAVTHTQGSGEVALRVAMETETVKGDLRAAIEQYKVIATGRDRALAAKALVRMAQCYQRLGDAESRATYERILRDFADQKEEVAVARARLGGPGAVARSQGERRLALDPIAVFPGTVSADGRFVSYADRRSGDVFVRDLTTGIDRLIRRATSSERGGFSSQAVGGRIVERDVALGTDRVLFEPRAPGTRCSSTAHQTAGTQHSSKHPLDLAVR